MLGGFAGLLVLVTALPAAAAGTLDQSQTAMTGARCLGEFCGSDGLAQTFTAGITGKLDQVDLLPSRVVIEGSAGSIIVEIQALSGGVPSGTVLGSGTIAETDIAPINGTPAWVSAALTSPAPVIAGQRYAIVLRANGGSYEIGIAADVYPGGELVERFGASWFAQGVDLTFKTYVTPDARPCGHHCHHP